MHSKPSAAEQALDEAFQDRPNIPDPETDDLLKQFFKVFFDKHPDSTFTVAHLLKWVKSYVAINQSAHSHSNPTPLPKTLSNGYSLGKYLKKHQKHLGIAEAGSYGNRVVYCITSIKERS